MLIRIFTENKNYDKVTKIVKIRFDYFTIINGSGSWKGELEHTLIIEIDVPIGDEVLYKRLAQNVCYDIKKLNKQDKVLIQYIDCTSKLI